jgi:hypothetical protein
MSRLWSVLLWAAAAYNLLIGVPGIINGTAPSDRIVSLLVACFGIVYAITGTDPRRYAAMLWAGIIGKLGIIALLWPSLSDGTAPAGTSIILAGDGLFTLGFFALLWTLRRRAN